MLPSANKNAMNYTELWSDPSHYWNVTQMLGLPLVNPISAKLFFYSLLLYVTEEKKNTTAWRDLLHMVPVEGGGTACSTKLQGSSAPCLEHLLSSLFSDVGICRAVALTFSHSCLTQLLLCFVVVLFLNPFSKTYSQGHHQHHCWVHLWLKVELLWNHLYLTWRQPHVSSHRDLSYQNPNTTKMKRILLTLLGGWLTCIKVKEVFHNSTTRLISLCACSENRQKTAHRRSILKELLFPSWQHKKLGNCFYSTFVSNSKVCCRIRWMKETWVWSFRTHAK